MNKATKRTYKTARDRREEHKCNKCNWATWSDEETVICMFPQCFKTVNEKRYTKI